MADRKTTFYRRPLSGLENSKVGYKSKLVVSVLLWHILPYHFNSLSAKYLIYKETLSKSRSLFCRSYSTQTFYKVKFMALSQMVVYSCLSISNLFELLETACINCWPLLFARELSLPCWQRSGEPRGVCSCARRALPALRSHLELPAPLHCTSELWALLELLSCTLTCAAGAPGFAHLPNFVITPQKIARSSSKRDNTAPFLAISTEEIYTW